MAFSAKLFIFLIIRLLSSTDARDSELFNKFSRTPATTTVLPTTTETQNKEQDQQPAFLPDNENGYGLYGHESGQLSPSATGESTTVKTPSTAVSLNKNLPKNYNPVSYVTQPDITDDRTPEEQSLDTNPTNYYNSAQNYYNAQQEEDEQSLSEYRNYPSSIPNNKHYYAGGSSFNSEPQGLSDTRLQGATFRNGFQPQGMSDTRHLENGKYFYDVKTERYSRNHPYESLKANRERNYYGNSENVNYEFNNNENSMGGYQNQDEFQMEDSNALP